MRYNIIHGNQPQISRQSKREELLWGLGNFTPRAGSLVAEGLEGPGETRMETWLVHKVQRFHRPTARRKRASTVSQRESQRQHPQGGQTSWVLPGKPVRSPDVSTRQKSRSRSWNPKFKLNKEMWPDSIVKQKKTSQSLTWFYPSEYAIDIREDWLPWALWF